MEMCSKWSQVCFVLLGVLVAFGRCESDTPESEARFPLTPLSPKCFVVKNECPNENVTFFLYREDRQDDPYQLDFETIKDAPVDKNLPVKVLIHGYTAGRDMAPSREIRPAYFSVGDMNVISIDYHPLVEDGCYLQAVSNLETVGHCLADLLEAGIENDVWSLSQIHLIGHSLGAHTAGFVQKYMKSGNITRVTGLDPALPLFYLSSKENSLSNDDADFVDVIHTNIGLAGKILPSGDVDFYANGGVIQPGCLKTNFTNPIGCDHNRAPVYFAESIYTKTGFYGVKCEDYLKFKKGLCRRNRIAIMGEKTPSDTPHGTYFVETNDKKPFAQGKPKNKRKPNRDDIKNNIIYRQRRRAKTASKERKSHM